MPLTGNRPRVLIADDHTLVAELCKKMLEPEFQVVGTADNGRTLIQMAEELRPDLIVVDIAMPILNGLDAGKQIKKMLPSVKLLYLTMSLDSQLAADAFRCGASAYLLKTCAASELVVAVREVMRGMRYLSPSIAEETRNRLRFQSPKITSEDDRLTRRQREVLQLLAEGKAMKEVGDILNLTTRTVAFHKYRIMETIGAKNNADLVKYAIRNHVSTT